MPIYQKIRVRGAARYGAKSIKFTKYSELAQQFLMSADGETK